MNQSVRCEVDAGGGRSKLHDLSITRTCAPLTRKIFTHSGGLISPCAIKEIKTSGHFKGRCRSSILVSVIYFPRETNTERHQIGRICFRRGVCGVMNRVNCGADARGAPLRVGKIAAKFRVGGVVKVIRGNER